MKIYLKFFLSILLLNCFLLPLNSAFASETDDFWTEGLHDDEEEPHGHLGVHGGQFGDANDLYHYEVLINEKNQLIVYLYDGKARPMATTGVAARWTLFPGKAETVSGDFKELEDGSYYFIELPELTSEELHVKVEALREGEWLPVEFILLVP